MKTVSLVLSIVTMVLAMIWFATYATYAADFDSIWDYRVKRNPDPGVATEFDDRRGAWGNKINPSRDMVCAHLHERRGTKLRVTNIENGKSVVCEVQDRGPDRDRNFWPRRTVDMTPPVNRAIECAGYCRVKVEREMP